MTVIEFYESEAGVGEWNKQPPHIKSQILYVYGKELGHRRLMREERKKADDFQKRHRFDGSSRQCLFCGRTPVDVYSKNDEKEACPSYIEKFLD